MDANSKERQTSIRCGLRCDPTWYQKHLGMPLEPWGGAALRWPEDKAEDKGVTAWHIAKSDTKWFAPSDASFMQWPVGFVSAQEFGER